MSPHLQLTPHSFLVVDNFLSKPFLRADFDRIRDLRDKRSGSNYNWVPRAEVRVFSDVAATILDQTLGLTGFDEQSVVGVECWGNELEIGDSFPMHSDIDEYRYRTTRRLRCAPLGLIYFVECTDLRGGNIIFDDGIVVGARENRCVIFFGGSPHAVDRLVRGIRRTLVMSIWDEVPLGYRQESNFESSRTDAG